MELFNKPLMDLVFEAHVVHRANHDPNKVQISRLCSIKTGSCPEDCKYCSQSAHYNTGLKKEPLMKIEDVLQEAKSAKDSGSERFCMGAAWKKLHDRDVDTMCEIIKGVKDLGLETCMTLGMVTAEQASRMKDAGLDYYNHNLDTSEEFYEKIITTRSYQDRLDTLANVADAGIKVCSGGILGMGESTTDRAKMLMTLANLPTQPDSVPINMLVPIEGTPLGGQKKIDSIDFVRTVAVARILMPKAAVRLSAGRLEMSEEMQALCFFAGANSVFYGDKLLTTDNTAVDSDKSLFKKLGMN